MTLDRRQFLRLSALAVPLTVPLLSACGGDDDPKTGDTPPTIDNSLALEQIGNDYANGLRIGSGESELVVGTSRFSFGILDPTDGPVTDADVTVYAGRSAKAPALATAKARWIKEGVEDKALYVADLPFPAAGEWLVAVLAVDQHGAKTRGGLAVDVKATSPSPVKGQRAISTPTPTTAKPAGADPLCSRVAGACSMHAISLDAALKNGKPTVITFSAPAFCQTETCGPVVDIVDAIAKEKAGAMNFIHVEAFVNQGKALAKPLTAWKFTSEPWTYFIDSKGVVSDRISGALGSAEVRDRVAKLS